MLSTSRQKSGRKDLPIAWALLAATWIGIIGWVGWGMIAEASAVAGLPAQLKERYVDDENVTDLKILASGSLTALWAKRQLEWSDESVQNSEFVVVDTDTGYRVSLSLDLDEAKPTIAVNMPGDGSMIFGPADDGMDLMMIPATGPNAGKTFRDSGFTGHFEPVEQAAD